MLRRRAAVAAFCWMWLAAVPAGALPRGPYALEPEVHLAFGAGEPTARAGGYGGGVGGRASVTVGSFGVSPRVADWLAVGAGLDFVRHAGGASPYGPCVERTPAPAGTSVCTRIDAPNGARSYLLLPVVAQWSLAVAPPLSLFVEPGVGIVLFSDGAAAAPAFALGARYRLADAANAVLRLGWPLATLGISF
jgi:hypothetical protein